MVDNNLNNEKIKRAMEKLQEKTDVTEEQLERLRSFAEKYKGKSEEDIFFEIIKLNNIMSQNMSKEEYEKKMEKLNKIRPMLNEEQCKKLDKMMEAFKESK